MADTTITSTVLTGGAEALQKYFDAEVNRSLKSTNHFRQFAKQRGLPEGSHLEVETVFNEVGVTLAEALSGNEIDTFKVRADATTVEIPVVELSFYQEVSYKARKETHFDLLVELSIELARKAGELIDEYIQNAINDPVSGIPVVSAQRLYMGDATSRATVAAGDTLSAVKLIDAYGKLDSSDVVKIDGTNYVAITSSLVAPSLRKETGPNSFNDVFKYTNAGSAQAAFNGELGSVHGFRVVSSSNVKPYVGAGADGIDVYPTYCIGKDAYVFLSGDELRNIVKMPGATSTDNPADKKATSAVYARFGSKVLRKNAIVIIESALV